MVIRRLDTVCIDTNQSPNVIFKDGALRIINPYTPYDYNPKTFTVKINIDKEE